MGTWMSHLRIAGLLLDHRPDLEPAAFVVGNLSPDSGIPNADHSAFDPPKEVTHYLRKGEGEHQIKDLRFYRDYLLDVDPGADLAAYSFRLGYFTHLLFDGLWSKRIGPHYRSAYPALFAAHGQDAWWIIKEDWYDLDLKYVRDHPLDRAWQVFRQAQNPPALVPFLPEAALHQQLDRIRQFYSTRHTDRVLDRAYPYLNEAVMNRFVADSSAAIRHLLDRLHTEAQDFAGHESALALLPLAEIAPYTPPIGDPA